MQIEVTKIFDDLLAQTKKREVDNVNKLSDEVINAKKNEFIDFYQKRDFKRCALLFSDNLYYDSVFMEFFLNYCHESKHTTKDEFTYLLYLIHMKGNYLFRMYRFEDVLDFYESAEIPYLPMKECKEMYNNLDEEFTIYRGSVNYDIEKAWLGICWSTEEKVAKRFTIGNSGSNINRVLFKGTANKSDIYGIMYAMHEYEIVIDPNKIRIIEQRRFEDLIKN